MDFAHRWATSSHIRVRRLGLAIDTVVVLTAFGSGPVLLQLLQVVRSL